MVCGTLSFYHFYICSLVAKKPCKHPCLQGFLNSPSWARTNNPAVNSRVLYHWAIEDYSVFLHIFFGVRPCRCSAIELSRITLFFSQYISCGSPPLIYLQNYILKHHPTSWFLVLPSLWHSHKSFFRSYLSGQAFDRLVTVSSMHCCTSTSALSTSSSSRGLISSQSGISHLEGGFTLRCLQRLSRPGLATLLWPWQASRCTSGRSIPVLSY